MVTIWILFLSVIPLFSAEILSPGDILRRLDALDKTVLQNEDDLLAVKSEDEDQEMKIMFLDKELVSAVLSNPNRNHADATVNDEPILTTLTEPAKKGLLKETVGPKHRRRSVTDMIGATSGVYQRVAFTATFSGNTPQTLSDSKPTFFPNVVLNVRRGYNPASGIFVTPVPGVYIFSVSGLSHEGYQCSLELVKKGKGVAVLRAEAVPKRRDQGAITVILLLEEQDKVYVRGYHSDGVPFWGDRHSVFTGVMLWALA